MRLSKASLAALASFMISTVTAQSGIIACVSDVISGGSWGDLPVHNAEFTIDGQTYIGGSFATDCGQMPGLSPDLYTNFEGNGVSVGATFWITSDLCLNIEVGGIHHWCCPGKIIGFADGGVTTCDF